MEALDRVKEILADGDHPFPVDRKQLKDLMRAKMGQDVERIKFLSSGMFLWWQTIAWIADAAQ